MFDVRCMIKKLVLVSCLLPTMLMAMGTSKLATHAVGNASLEQQVVNAVNEIRAKRGLSRLSVNTLIVQEARSHSLEMERKSVPFGHDGFFTRIKHLQGRIKGYNGGSENVAWYPPSKSPRDVVNLWMTSSGHRRNILGSYQLTGVGIVRDKRGWLYYTQIFINDNRQPRKRHFGF